MQLLRLMPAFEGLDIAYATLDAGCRADVGVARFYVVRDGSRWHKLQLILSAFSVLGVVLRERPGFVISTGAAPGLFGIVFGKLLRARTIWVDSIANADKLSMSGQIARRWADLWLTQWPELSTPDGPEYAGAVL